jgi:hypothetical protein
MVMAAVMAQLMVVLKAAAMDILTAGSSAYGWGD